MINEESVRALHTSRLNEHFGKPLYDTYAFAQIPATIKRLLLGLPGGLPPKALAHFPDRYNKVILFLIDAFGWRFFSQYHERYPFLDRFVREGVVNKISAQFPSTTSAHMTTIHTGLPVGESGIYEWFIYEPTVDAIITPLMFNFAGELTRDTLKQASIAPKALFPRQSLHRELREQGIKTYVFGDRDYTPSSFSEAVAEGTRFVPYKTISEALVNLRHLVQAERDRAYYFVYYDAIDSLGHFYGPDSPQFEAEIDTFFNALERVFHREVYGKLGDTLVLVTADHGQVEISPETTIYLNRTLPGLASYLKTDLRGNLLVPAGSARDIFLHVKPAFLDEAYASLSAHLDGRAEVYRVQDLIEQGFFGPTISPIFRSRVADLVVLPYAEESVWWYERGKFEQRFSGHHGGLTPGELESILLALPY